MAEQDTFLKRIEANKGIIIKICNSYCANPSDREDLSQEIIYQLLRSAQRFDEAQRFSTWMYRVALNVAISFYRKNLSSQKFTFLPADETEIADHPPNEQEEHFKQLQQFIYELKELDKALMILYLDAKPYQEIAGIVGISETNVASRISRIKEKLKQKFIIHT